MFKSHFLLLLVLLAGAVLAPGCGNTVNSDSGPTSTPVSEQAPATPSTPRFSFRIVHIYPHDPLAFTQGLIYYNDRLYEGTGQRGRSSLRLVDLETGKVLRIHYLPERYFGEGIAVFDNKIIQLTWQSNLGFVYELSTFEQLREFPYATEGWGITYDGRAYLYFWNPQSLLETGRVEVRDQGNPVTNLNELEYIRGTVYANVWGSDRIARIDPASGTVTGWIELEGLLAYMDLSRPIDVLNGIAYDSENDRLFVTGKLWPNLFEIELVPVN
ncbi:MAG: glutaminyl-peptide cyclotransferase [Acidobacteriota bacterium]